MPTRMGLRTVGAVLVLVLVLVLVGVKRTRRTA